MKKKHSIKNHFFSAIFSIFVIIFLIYFIFKDFGLYQLIKLKNKKQNLTQQVISIKDNKNKITQEINKLTKDSLYIEKIAREKYSMVKKGEIIIPITKE
tara:strand:+ start:8 stop:304 length:297 start_codon:yes stop_codon:yes gene_type:complete